MDLFKALIPSTLLTLVLCGILGANHSTGGYLNIFHMTVHGVSFYWSWPLFLVSTGLAWALFAMTPE
ncbi:MAG: hypothetical protein ABI673_11165 [Novosphingobium sp.]